MILKIINGNFTKKESVNFLLCEFNQSFQHLRHYDQIQNLIISLSLSWYTAIFTLAYIIYNYKTDSDIKYKFLVTLFIIAFFAGIIVLLLFVRNRLYYTIIAQQVNTIRNYFLNNSELNFVKYNKSYINPNKPKNFHLWSTDSMYICIVALINSILAGIGFLIYFYFILETGSIRVLLIITITIFLAQLYFVYIFFRKRDGLLAHGAIFK